MEANHTTPVCRLNSGWGYVDLIGWICLCCTQSVTDHRLDVRLSMRRAAVRCFCGHVPEGAAAHPDCPRNSLNLLQLTAGISLERLRQKGARTSGGLY